MSLQISRRTLLKLSVIPAFGVFFATYRYSASVEPENIQIVEQELILPRLAPAFDGYRLVQISDIHMGTGMTQERLSRIVRMINAQQPDLVAITGDFVTHGDVEPLADSLIQPLRQLQTADGVMAVLGNHDHVTDADAVRRVLEAAGVRNVSNTFYTLERGDQRLHIAGVDSVWYQKDRLEAVMSELPEDGAAILLAHEPDHADKSAATGRFDLQISGHSHGGQVVMPLINRPLALPHHGRKYPRGQYQVGSMIQYTNRGIGTSFPPVRFNCPPEITVFTLRARGQVRL